MRRKSIASGVLIISIFLPPLMWSQVITGTILGTVADSAGAVIPGASVTVREVATGSSHTANTDGSGRYRVPELPSGSYEVTASFTGFQTMVRSGITMTVGREAVVDFTLQVGTVAESVTVVGEAPLVNTVNATVSGLVSDQSVRSLPLNGRSLGDLANTQAGVIGDLPIGGGGNTGQTATYGSIFIGGGVRAIRVVSGTTAQQNTYLLDGIETSTGSRGTPVSSIGGDQLGVDAIREFMVIQSTAGAQFGRAAGGVVNAVSQSGTNTFHGSAFEFLRNEMLDARDYFLNPQFRQTPYKRNQLGGALGGRIKKDRTFFFTNYEAVRIGGAVSFLGSTLTPETRTGKITNDQGRVVQTLSVDPNLAPLMNLLPLPNGAYLNQGVAQYFSQNHYNLGEDFGTARLDEQLSGKDSFFGRITIDRSSRTDAFSQLTPVPSFGYQTGGYVLGALSWTRIPSPTILNIARFGYTRRNDSMWNTYTQGGSQFPNAPGVDPRLQAATGIPMAGNYGIPGVNLYGPIGAGTQSQARFVDNIFLYSDSLMASRGRHSLVMGVEIKRYQQNVENCANCYGPLSWQTIQTFLTNVPFTSGALFSFATPGTYLADTYRGYRQTYGALFVQDDLQLRSNFTLNLGLRWEKVRSPREVNGKLAAFINLYTDPDLTRLTDSGAPAFAIRTPLAGFSPRFGFAWSPRGNGRTVVRGGFGMYTEPPMAYMFDTAPHNPLLTSRKSLNAPDLKFPFPFPDPASVKGALNPWTHPQDFKEPYTMQWSLSLQRQFGGNLVVKANYIGLRGLDQIGVTNPNQAPPIRDLNGRYFTPANASVLNPAVSGFMFITPMGDQWYNAGQLVIERRFSGGLALNSSYTWSRNLGNFPFNWNGTGSIPGTGGAAYNLYDLAAEKGLAAMNVSHNWITTATYQLPFGSGRRWGSNWTGVSGKLLGGWSVNATHTARTGLPLTISMTPRQSRCIQTCAERPDLIPGGNNNPVRDHWTPESYFDPSQFVVQPLGYFGNVGRNTLIGPGMWNLNFSLSKETRIAEGKDLSFRAEFFNLLNHPNFAPPSASVFQSAAGALSPTSGIITATNGSMRQIQFGLRFTF